MSNPMSKKAPVIPDTTDALEALEVLRDYQTAAGFVLAHVQHLPSAGEHVEVSGWRFEVVDLDGRRVDKVLASRVPVSRRQLG
jgi:Mg2+/Co2+ transporter CorC